METIYKEIIGDGRFWYYVYSDGVRIQVPKAWAEKEIYRGAKVVRI